jgi:succinate dehydrogenase / fumarate reductase, cytochrome b subunit
VNNQRPVNIGVTTFKFPITAISSITHRVTGVILFFAVPILLWALGESIGSASGLQSVKECINSPLGKFVTWGIVSSVLFHVIAGLRHLLMDMGIGEELESARMGAMLVMVLSALSIIAAGVWLW